jgi:alpha-galactosidase
LQPDYFGKGVEVDLVEVEMLKNFGYFTSGSQAHLSMYLPYFRKRPILAEKYKLDNYGPIFEGAPKRTADETEKLKKQLSDGYKFPFTPEYRWSKHAADVMDSIETGTIRRIDGNVKNRGLVTNLQEGCCVEVPCLVDKNGVHPCYIGDLPPQCAALNRTNISEQELTVRGVVEKDKNMLFQSILIDPLAGALLTIEETREMVDAMFQIDKPFLKGFK